MGHLNTEDPLGSPIDSHTCCFIKKILDPFRYVIVAITHRALILTTYTWVLTNKIAKIERFRTHRNLTNVYGTCQPVWSN
jgi:hypothetical protein